jgi:glycosyltransferase involved in cell wall biosynthesis
MSGTRTLVVSHFFPPEELGGAHRWQRLVANLPDDHDCRVLCPPPAFPYGEFDRSRTPIERTTVDGVPVTRLWTYQPRSDSTSADSNLGRILNYTLFALFSSLYVLCTFWRYDAIVTVSAPHTTFVPGAVGKALGLTWVPDIFDLWLDNALDIGYVERGSIPYRLVWRLERLALTRSDHVLVITETMAEHFASKHGVSSDRFTIVPFGVDAEQFTPATEPTQSNTVVYTGNMGEAHALRPFLSAFDRLDGVAELELVGTGKRRDELERFCREQGIDDRVTFRGVVPRTEVPGILRDAAASIVPLKQEHRLDYARPTKLLESMATGTPYVASSLAEIDRITDSSNAGFAVDNDPEAIAAAISTVVEDPEGAHEMGRRGVAFVEREHRWPVLADRVAEVLGST